MFKLIDKLYLNFYWCWNTDKKGSLKDVTLSKDIMILLWAILFISFSPIIPFIPIKLSNLGYFACFGGIAFILSELIMLKYNDERKVKILNKYDKPGKSRFAVFALFTIISVLIGISSFFIGSGIIDNIKCNR